MKNNYLYYTWSNIKQRCYNKKHPSYKYYGARGIKVCDRWINNFDIFSQDMGEKPNKDYSIDRINNDGNYEPSNCRWATKSQQQLNKRARTEEHKKNIGLTKIGNQYWIGKKHKEDSKLKMRITKMENNHKGKLLNLICDVESGKSIYSLTKKYNICKRTIKKIIQEKELWLKMY
jgi:hypothetical protein